MLPLRRSSTVIRWTRKFYFDRLTRAGRWFLWPSLAFLAYAMVSVRGQIFLPASFAFAVWLFGLFAARALRPTAHLRVEHGDRIGAGEVLPVLAEVELAGRRTGRDLLLRPMPLPDPLRSEPPDGAPLPRLRPGESVRARAGIACPQRGAYLLPGFRVETDFPFGIARTTVDHSPERRILVRPRFSPLAALDLPAARRYQPGGIALASHVGESAEFIGNREYRDGDSVRDIDWRATARLQRPIVREYREEYFLRAAVVLDTQVAPDGPPERCADFERAVSLCAAIGDYLGRQEYVVDLFAAGPNLHHLTAGRSLAYLDQILDILACVEPCVDLPFPRIEPELVENLTRISAVVCLFLDWDEERREFTDLLRRQGVGVKPVIVRTHACRVDPRLDARGTEGLVWVDFAGGTAPGEL